MEQLTEARGYIRLDQWYERCTADHELLDRTPRVTQFEVRKIKKELQMLQELVAQLVNDHELHVGYHIEQENSSALSEKLYAPDELGTPSLLHPWLPGGEEADLDL